LLGKYPIHVITRSLPLNSNIDINYIATFFLLNNITGNDALLAHVVVVVVVVVASRLRYMS
jgi:hypothetical protein